MKSSLQGKAEISDSLLHRLNLYALAAGAAGVAAVAQPADAKIVYTPIHRVINNGQHYNLDLNRDRITDFTLQNKVSCDTDQCFYDLTVAGNSGNEAIGINRGSFLPYASALVHGSRIGPQRQFVGPRAILGYVYQGGGGTSSHGPWKNVTNHFLGMRFKIKGKTHFGWARLNVRIVGVTVSATLTGYAYETEPNKPIVAGKTDSTAPTTASHGTLGDLARGTR